MSSTRLYRINSIAVSSLLAIRKHVGRGDVEDAISAAPCRASSLRATHALTARVPWLGSLAKQTVLQLWLRSGRRVPKLLAHNRKNEPQSTSIGHRCQHKSGEREVGSESEAEMSLGEFLPFHMFVLLWRQDDFMFPLPCSPFL
jgi:hypothetical protein